jgi:hypothetical protein
MYYQSIVVFRISRARPFRIKMITNAEKMHLSGLVDLWYEKHCRVDHGRNQFVKRKVHINGIENF